MLHAISRAEGDILNSLLVVPRMIKNDGDYYSFPLGMSYISAVLKQNGFNIFCLNLNHVKGNDMIEILRCFIAENDIDLVACGGFSYFSSEIKSVFDAAKSVSRGGGQ